ncbi:peptidase S8, partial [Campylobacter lari]|nr:peptidase S8 [Campylobacter lari]
MKKYLIIFIFITQILALNDFEVINVHKAHDLNITGKNINVGIIDSAFNANHPSLQGQIIEQQYSTVNNKPYTPDLTVDTHGSHVAGIILGNFKNIKEPYGIAYNAKMYGIQIFGYNNGSQKIIPYNIYDYFKDKEIKIINNSWNTQLYPIVGMSQLGWYVSDLKKQNSNYFLNLANNNKPLDGIIKLAKEKNILILFAAGNEGVVSPGFNATLPYYDENLRSWLSIGAIDSSKITKDENGKLILSSKAIASYSNGLKGVENFSLVAPGSFVNSVNAAYNIQPIFGRPDKNLYVKMSGTSMATPMVSGAAALVSEKFPFLNGKQIADVLLSTANKNYKTPKLTVKETQLLNTSNGRKQSYYTIIYIDTPIPDDKNKIKQDLIDAGYWSFEADKILNNLIDKYPLMQNANEDYKGIQTLKKEQILGQGILDIEKAINGIGILDANRLNSQDITDTYGEKEAYYTINTQGYNATFSNDISQKKWDDSLHRLDALNSPKDEIQNLNIGFIKDGQGRLILSGENTYLGKTIVKEGELSLIKTQNNKGIISGEVKVLTNGKFSGNGLIKNNLYNQGIVRPGNQDLSDLIVEGLYNQKNNAILQLDFGNNGNSKLIANSYQIEGGKLQYIPLPMFYTSGNIITINLAGLKNNINDFEKVEISGNNSIDFVAVLDEDKVSINKPA